MWRLALREWATGAAGCHACPITSWATALPTRSRGMAWIVQASPGQTRIAWGRITWNLASASVRHGPSMTGRTAPPAKWGQRRSTCRRSNRRAWNAEDCAKKLTPFLDRIDTLILARRDAATLFHAEGTPADMLRALQERFGVKQVVMTLAESGAMGLSDGTIHEVPGYRATLIDRIGA